ncbi:MAG TPA: hypothetical protein ENN30_00315 [Candidatus Woesearchaeota archaeon]|nr:hypothetical protein [Candidatus Woesearchaeota archaeon]
MKQKDKPSLCYVTYKRLTETDKDIYDKLSRNFTVTHAKMDDLVLKISKGKTLIKFKGLNVALHSVIWFRVPKFCYQSLSQIVKQIPLTVKIMQGRKGFGLLTSKLLVYQTLTRRNIDVPNIIFAEDVDTVASNLKGIRFPVLIRVTTDKNKVMLANSEIEVKSMMDALKVLDQPIFIEEYHPEAELHSLYVVGAEVVAATKTKVMGIDYDGETFDYGPKKEEVQIALEVASALGSKIAKVEILSNPMIVVDADICPYIKEASRITGIDIAEKISKFVYSESGVVV